MKKLNTKTYRYSSKATSYCQFKVHEVNDGFLLNTVYHQNKELLQPTTSQLFNDISSNSLPEYNMILSKVVPNANNYFNYNKLGKTCVPDLYTPNVYYTLMPFCTIKYEESNGSISEIKTTIADSSNNCYYYLGQNEEFIFYMGYPSGSYRYIYKMSKETLAATQIYNYYAYDYHYRPTVLKETQRYIYFFHLSTSSSSTSGTSYYPRLHISRIDKEESTAASYKIQETVSIPNAAYRTNIVSEAIVKVNDNIYGIILKSPSSSTSADEYVKYVQVDFTDPDSPTVTSSNLSITDFVAPGSNQSSCYTTDWHCFINTVNGVDYFNMIRHYNYTNSTDAENKESTTYFAVYIFEILKNSSNVPIGLSQVFRSVGNDLIDSDVISYLVSSDGKLLLFNTKKGFYILTRSETTNEYIMSQNFSHGGIYSYGIDELNRIWYLRTDSYRTVEFIGLTDFSKYNLEFEKASYAYQGEDINTFIKLRCLDVLNNRMDANFNLTIVGNATFDASRTKTLTVTSHSTDDADIVVPLTINGAGRVIVYPSLVTE